jgi:hypothetical protein
VAISFCRSEPITPAFRTFGAGFQRHASKPRSRLRRLGVSFSMPRGTVEFSTYRHGLVWKPQIPKETRESVELPMNLLPVRRTFPITMLTCLLLSSKTLKSQTQLVDAGQPTCFSDIYNEQMLGPQFQKTRNDAFYHRYPQRGSEFYYCEIHFNSKFGNVPRVVVPDPSAVEQFRIESDKSATAFRVSWSPKGNDTSTVSVFWLAIGEPPAVPDRSAQSSRYYPSSMLRPAQTIASIRIK